MMSFQEALDKINNEISHITYESKPTELYDPISYTLSLGGKRIRPALVLLAYNMYKEENPDSILPTALGWEIFHNFTLLHDDLMDWADVRRGKPTVHKKWGNNTAILSGDAMLILAYQYIAQTPQEHLKPVLDLFSITAAEICGGQQYDMNFETLLSVSEEEYIEMIRLKTAVMLGACLKSGAILGGASARDAQNLYDFGIYIGIAFQLKDDLLDVYGDPTVFGKNIGGDILCNKKTFLLIHALNKAQGKEHEALLKWLAVSDPQLNRQKIEAVTDIYNSLKLKELSEDKMQFYFQKAIVLLKELDIPSDRTVELLSLAEKLMDRII